MSQYGRVPSTSSTLAIVRSVVVWFVNSSMEKNALATSTASEPR